jgi:hypothetical protein
MLKKLVLSLALIVSAVSFASDNGDKKGFVPNPDHSGPIYTNNRTYGQMGDGRINVNDQWGYNESEEARQMRLHWENEQAYKHMKENSYYQNGCTIN